MPRSLIRLISPTTKSCEDVHLLISKSVNSHSQNLKSDLCRCVLICSIYFLMCRLDETHKLIEVRSVMATQLRKDGSKKKPTWKDVAVTLAGLGFNRSPEQCSSMWSSLVKKYEAVVEERKAGALKEWTYFEAMKAALSKQGKSKSSKSPVAASTR
jgi:hypothetical protein